MKATMSQLTLAVSIAALALGAIANIRVTDKITLKTLRDTPVHSAQSNSAGKYNPYEWGELQQTEVNALQKALEKLPKKPVTIFCSDDNCRNITLDFDNAFESAKWSTLIERPFMDSSVGVWTSSKEIAAAIEAAVGWRFKVSILGPEWKDNERIALAIGRKPR